MYATEEAKHEYSIINAAHDKNQSLKLVPGAFELYSTIVKLDNANLHEKISILSHEPNDFNSFVKFTFIDFAINCQRISPAPINDERNFFFENVLPIFKYFGNLTQTLSFRWGGGGGKDSATALFYVNKNKGETKLADGMGTTSRGNNFIVIESSGFNQAQDIRHAYKDTMKNLVSATDTLLNLMCKYEKASLATTKKVNVYSFHVIQKKISLVRYSVKDRTTWKAIECGAATVPLSYIEKKQMVKILDLFAFIYNDILSQEKVMEDLEDEHLGNKEVKTEDQIGPLNNLR